MNLINYEIIIYRRKKYKKVVENTSNGLIFMIGLGGKKCYQRNK